MYSVITATGQTPPDVSGVTVNSILRAFNTLIAATTGSADVNHLNTSDLVAGGFQLNWVGYNDGPDPSSHVRIEEPWVTGHPREGEDEYCGGEDDHGHVQKASDSET